MKKTVFVGQVNDQKFDNVNDYNACVQAMMDMGQDFQATSSTQVVEVPEDDCDCTCSGKDECSKCNHAKKPLRAVTSFLPAYEDKENGAYIDKLINAETEEEFNSAMDNVDIELNKTYNKIIEAIPHNTPEQIEVFTNAAGEMVDILTRDYTKTMNALEPIAKRIDELEKELDSLYETANKLDMSKEVIETYAEFYGAVAGAIGAETIARAAADIKSEDEDCNDTEVLPWENQDEVASVDPFDGLSEEEAAEVNAAVKKLSSGFRALLDEIFGAK